MHRHRPKNSTIRPFWGPVGNRQNPAAHGNVQEEQTCSCGAVRYVNVNGVHVERGEWFCPQEVRQ